MISLQFKQGYDMQHDLRAIYDFIDYCTFIIQGQARPYDKIQTCRQFFYNHIRIDDQYSRGHDP